MIEKIIYILMVFILLIGITSAQEPNVIIDSKKATMEDFKLTIADKYYSLTQVDEIQDSIYAGNNIELITTIIINHDDDDINDDDDDDNDILLKTSVQNPKWYVGGKVETGDTIKVNADVVDKFDIRLVGVMMPNIDREETSLSSGAASIKLIRDNIDIDEKALILSVINSKGDQVIQIRTPVTHPRVVRTQDKLQESKDIKEDMLKNNIPNKATFESVSSKYENTIDILIKYGLFNDAYTATDNYIEFLNAEDETNKQIEQLTTNRYLYAFFALIIGCLSGGLVVWLIVKNKLKDQEGEEPWS